MWSEMFQYQPVVTAMMCVHHKHKTMDPNLTCDDHLLFLRPGHTWNNKVLEWKMHTMYHLKFISHVQYVENVSSDLDLLMDEYLFLTLSWCDCEVSSSVLIHSPVSGWKSTSILTCRSRRFGFNSWWWCDQLSWVQLKCLRRFKSSWYHWRLSCLYKVRIH